MIQIPAERVPPIAKEVAETKKMYAALWWVGTLLTAVAGFATSGTSHHHHDAAFDAGQVAGMGFWVVVLFMLGLRLWRIAGRATRAVELANAGHTSFVLSNKLLIALDERGVSLTDATFKIGGKHVTMLLALPAATLVAKDSNLPRG